MPFVGETATDAAQAMFMFLSQRNKGEQGPSMPQFLGIDRCKAVHEVVGQRNLKSLRNEVMMRAWENLCI